MDKGLSSWSLCPAGYAGIGLPATTFFERKDFQGPAAITYVKLSEQAIAPPCETRGIADGDEIEVFNDRGKIPLRAKVSASVPAGVAASRLGWNKLTRDGQGVNSLTSETLTDLGGGPTFYSTLVEVRRAH